jgi:hypothetical protein
LFAFPPQAAVAESGQNAGLDGQKVALAPLGSSQHQQKVVYVPEGPVRLQGLGNARGDSRGNLIALR